MNTALTFSFSGDDQSESNRVWRKAQREETPSLSSELNRMLSAAVVSAAFRRLLLSDPVAALTAGYNGESFEIGAEDLTQIVLIRASSLAEFAGELIDRLWYGRRESIDRPVHRQYNRADSPPRFIREPMMVLATPEHDAAAHSTEREAVAVAASPRQWLRH